MHITAAESQIMEALWRRGALSTEDLVAEVGAARNRGDATVKTLINRLLKKKALGSERLGGRHCYRALVQRTDYVQSESQDLLDRLFDGQLIPLVAHFANSRSLKPDEITSLKKLIADPDEDT